MASDEAPDATDAERLAALAVELRVLLGGLRRRLREQAHVGDFTASQVQVLAWLEREGPATVTALARAQGVRPQSMGETVAALRAAGLVSGAPDPADGRQTVLSLTAACREKIATSRAAREDWLFRAFQTRFSPAEHQQLATGIDLLKRLLEP
jgi:DNA-binding MarR family transcriptional regulator